MAELVEIAPDSPHTGLVRATVALARNQPDAALTILDAMIEAGHDSRELRQARAQAMRRRQSTER